MAGRDIDGLMRDILEAAQDAMGFVEGLDSAAFERLAEEDRKTYRALKNAVAEIGAAVKRLPREITDRHPTVDWRGLSGLRDIVAHHYHRLDLQRLRPVLVDEFPELIAAVRAELGTTPEPPGALGR
jgi:uncharacterized protein with HEPN domain